MCRPDLTFGFPICAEIVSADTVATKKVNKVIDSAKKRPSLSLSYVPLEPTSLGVVVFTDASFASNADLTSQSVFVIGLVVKQSKGNNVHYDSLKSKRVPRRVLASELFAVIHEFDFASAMRKTILDMLDRQVLITVYTDSKILYDAMTGMNTTTEVRLLIYLTVLQQAYELREIAEIV